VDAPALRQLTLADLEAEIARAAGDGDEPAGAAPEAIIVLLIPRGSPFELYAGAIAPGIAAAHGRAQAVKIDTTAEPDAPRRFGLSGAPGLVLFLGGKQVAAFAVPFAGALGPLAGPWIQKALEGIRGLLPPPGKRPE
jgi:hypothetical protein